MTSSALLTLVKLNCSPRALSRTISVTTVPAADAREQTYVLRELRGSGHRSLLYQMWGTHEPAVSTFRTSVGSRFTPTIPTKRATAAVRSASTAGN